MTSPERRDYQPIDTPAHYVSKTLTLHSRLSGLSAEGAFLCATEHDPERTFGCVEFQIDDISIAVPVDVIYYGLHDGSAGMALRFLNMSPEDQLVIRQALRKRKRP